LLTQKKPDEAVVYFTKAIETNPEYAHAHFCLGSALSLQKKPDEAIPMMWKALKLDPDYEVARRGLFNLVREHRNRDATITFFRNAVRDDPRNPLAHWFLGDALWYQGKRDESLGLFEKAAELAPKDGDFHYSLANNYRSLDQLDEAIAAYEKATHYHPKSAELCCEHGVALKRRGRIADAIAVWKRAIEIDPKYARAHTSLAWLLATAADPALRDPKAAVSHARTAKDLAPKTAAHWSNLGVALWRAADPKAAVEALVKADSMVQGGDLYHRFFLAMAYWQVGEKEKARAAFEQGVQWVDKNQPTNEELRRFRAEAEKLLEIEKK
jgi:superkiller protein 3